MDKVRNDGEWTEGRYRSFITSTLRGGMRRWPPKWKALKEAELGRKINKKSGKLAMHYTCAKCKDEYTAKDVQVDHIEPVVNTTTGFVSWDVYIDRMFCEKSNLQVLCTTCHKVKTKEEKNESTGVSRVSRKTSTTNSPKRPVSKSRTSRGSGGSSVTVRKSSKRQSGTSKPRQSKKGTG